MSSVWKRSNCQHRAALFLTNGYTLSGPLGGPFSRLPNRWILPVTSAQTKNQPAEPANSKRWPSSQKEGSQQSRPNQFTTLPGRKPNAAFHSERTRMDAELVSCRICCNARRKSGWRGDGAAAALLRGAVVPVDLARGPPSPPAPGPAPAIC